MYIRSVRFGASCLYVYMSPFVPCSSKQFHNSLRTPELPSPVGVPLRHTIMHMEGGSKVSGCSSVVGGT